VELHTAANGFSSLSVHSRPMEEPRDARFNEPSVNPMTRLTSRMAYFSSRLLLGAIGLLILAMLIPRVDPWTMDNVVLKVWPGRVLQFQIPFTQVVFAIPDRLFLVLVFAMFPVLALFTRTGRESVLYLAYNKTIFAGGALALFAAALTLVPGFLLHDLYVGSVVTYLLLGLYGTVFVCIGAYPLVDDARSSGRRTVDREPSDRLRDGSPVLFSREGTLQ